MKIATEPRATAAAATAAATSQIPKPPRAAADPSQGKQGEGVKGSLSLAADIVITCFKDISVA